MQQTIRAGGLAVAIAVVALVGGSQAQTPPAAPPPQPPQFPNMTFFVTSVGGQQGANYGGLELLPQRFQHPPTVLVGKLALPERPPIHLVTGDRMGGG